MSKLQYESCSKCGKWRIPKGKTIDEVGYRIIDYHRAVLFKIAKNATLDGSKEAQSYKGRLSFFKRLSLQNGNVASQWEDILIAVNPNGNFGKVGAVSPPYSEANSRGGGIAVNGYHGRYIDEMGKNQPDKVGERCGYRKDEHGSNPDNIGNLKDTPQKVGVISPPFLDSMSVNVIQNQIRRKEVSKKIWEQYGKLGYIEFQGKRYTKQEWLALNKGRKQIQIPYIMEKDVTQTSYSDNEANIGNLKDEE